MLFENIISISENKREFLVKYFHVGGILVYIFVFIALYIKAENPISGWTISDWLINYSDGGFKRRGLLGDILFYIQDVSGLRLQYQILIFQILTLSGILYGTFLYLKRYKIDIFYMCIMASPYILSFPALTVRNAGRREVILILIVLWYSLAKKSRFNDGVLWFIYIIFLFIHELGFFFLPFIIWINYSKWHKINLMYVLSIIVAAFTSIGIIYFLGGNVNGGESLSILKNRGVVFQRENIFDMEYFFDFHFVLQHKLSFLVHGIELFVTIFQIGFYIYLFKRKSFYAYIWCNIICVLWVIPLFYLGIDWMRWNYIYCTLLFIVFTSLLSTNESNNILFNNNFIKSSYLIFSVIFYLLVVLHLQHDLMIEWAKSFFS
ncbi:hypothetical protein BN1195_00688 [Chryseobacterium oranimense G311]|uniref:hypothetical protein n=1 Tax=Chryseobacterium oranimense TaxID=421058 RepID=UPI0005338EB4|nr:hypothetical protein [Chryseobacterium oranimense]CEJ68401.1 hypothetical protein BN1195_00688 [Chryseobacterium oranimense G311]